MGKMGGNVWLSTIWSGALADRLKVLIRTARDIRASFTHFLPHFHFSTIIPISLHKDYLLVCDIFGTTEKSLLRS